MAHSENNFTLQWIFDQAMALLISALITDGWVTLSVLLLLLIPANIAVFSLKQNTKFMLLPYILIICSMLIGELIPW
jgi:cellulose synthase/poly-beta-1,6-N-acetylglucosamine synthase-like glycosyltransferase